METLLKGKRGGSTVSDSDKSNLLIFRALQKPSILQRQ